MIYHTKKGNGARKTMMSKSEIDIEILHLTERIDELLKMKNTDYYEYEECYEKRKVLEYVRDF